MKQLTKVLLVIKDTPPLILLCECEFNMHDLTEPYYNALRSHHSSHMTSNMQV